MTAGAVNGKDITANCFAPLFSRPWWAALLMPLSWSSSSTHERAFTSTRRIFVHSCVSPLALFSCLSYCYSLTHAPSPALCRRVQIRVYTRPPFQTSTAVSSLYPWYVAATTCLALSLPRAHLNLRCVMTRIIVTAPVLVHGADRYINRLLSAAASVSHLLPSCSLAQTHHDVLAFVCLSQPCSHSFRWGPHVGGIHLG